MGLFGRDDRATDSKPQPAAPTPRAASPAAAPAAGATTVVARASRFEGVLSGSGDIHVEGELHGEIAATGNVTVAEAGRVTADVHARNLSVAGTVVGDLAATERIELTASATVHGNLTSPRILIRDGATFEGQVFMKQPERQPGGQGGGQASPKKGQPGGAAESKGPQTTSGAPKDGDSHRQDASGESQQGTPDEGKADEGRAGQDRGGQPRGDQGRDARHKRNG